MNFSMILAVDSKNGLGKNNTLAWRLSGDMQYFKQITSQVSNSEKQNAVIMGRKTWESIPEKFRPLPNRLNCILTKKIHEKDSQTLNSCLFFDSLDKSITHLSNMPNIEQIFVIGGAQIYAQALSHPALEKIYLTKVDGDFACEVFFPGVPQGFVCSHKTAIQEERGITFSFEIWEK